MTDDIVTEPEQEMDFVEYLRLWASPDTNDQAVRDLHKAADEIERLRAERDKFYHLARRLYNQHGKRGDEVLAEAYLLKEYEKAVEF